MKIRELREMTNEELNGRRRELKLELLHMRMQHASGQLENPARLRIAKKEVAHVETILSERRLGIVVGKPAVKAPPAPVAKEGPAATAAPKAVKKASAKKPSSDASTAAKPTSKKTTTKKATKTKAAAE